jgi:predicted 3-demethylubiquinone-9 3-methyltransferase (glyoxalase superfamily)
MPKITPFLWFNKDAAQAARFYTSIFKHSKILSVSPMSVSFVLEGQHFHAFNGGPHFTFTPAISLFVDCKDQAEVDALWNKLVKGGKPSRCGWLTDKYGLSWQIIPKALGKAFGGSDRAGAARAREAMMGMIKIDVKAIEAAYRGTPAPKARPAKRRTRA